MPQKEAYFRTALREELARRKRANAAYSLRSFAKHLGMQPPTLSAVLAGKRPLPIATAEALAQKLVFSPAEKKRFLNSAFSRVASGAVVRSIEASTDQAKLLNEELHFQIIAEWEHYAILALVETQGFVPKARWISKRLGISEEKAQAAWDRLQQAELMSVDSIGRVKLNQVRVVTSQDVVSAALRKSHRDALAMGIEKLEKVALHQRDYSSTTIAVSPGRLQEAKKLIRDFRKQISSLLEDGVRTDVYQICVQLYPLTDPKDQPGDLS